MQDGDKIFKVVASVGVNGIYTSYFSNVHELTIIYGRGDTCSAKVGYLFGFATFEEAKDYAYNYPILECIGYDFHPAPELINKILEAHFVDEFATRFWAGEKIDSYYLQYTPKGTIFCKTVKVINITHP